MLSGYTATLGVAAGLPASDDPRAYLPFRFAWSGRPEAPEPRAAPS